MGSGREFTAKYGASVTGFKSGMEQMVAELDKYNNALVKNQQQQKACNKIINEAQKELDKLEKEAKAGGGATEEQKKKIEELNAKIEKETKLLGELKTEQIGLKSAISDTTKQLSEQDGAAKNNTAAMEKYRDAMKNAGQAGKELATEAAAVGAAAIGATAGIYEFVKAGAQWADDLNTLSKYSGITTNELQKFEYASKLIDVSSETITGSLTKLTRNMQTAKDGSGAAAQAFETLGVSVTDASGNLRDRQDVFYEVIDALGKVGNETEMDALAMNIFGKSAQQLNPLIKGGAERLRELGDEAEKMGLILDQKTLDNLNEFNDSVDLLGAKGNQITKILASQAQPAVEGLVKVGDELLAEIKELADSGELEKYAKEVGALIEAGARALKNLLKWIADNKEMVVGFTAALVAFKAAMSIGTLIKNLVVAMKALTTATEGAAAAQGTLNTVQAANPIGLLLAVVGALTAGLSTYAMMAQISAGATGDLNGETKNYIALVQQAKKAASERQEQSETEINVLGTLKDRYDTLRTSVSLTAEEKKELDGIATELAKTIGTSVESLKEKDSTYKDLTGDIDDYIATLQRQIELEANKDELTAAYKSYNSALKAATETREKIAEQQAKLAEKEAEFDKKIAEAENSNDRNRSIDLAAQKERTLAKEQENLNKLNAAWADYYNQGGKAADIIKKVSEAMGSGEKAAQEWEEHYNALNRTTDAAAVSLDKLWKKTSDTGDAAEDAAKDTDYLTGSLGELTESTEAAEKAISKTEETISDTLSELESLGSLLGKVEKEITDSGSMSLGTLNSIIKKYPELTGAVDDYINGLTDEKTIIDGLKKAYDKDIDAYQAAISLKKLASGEFTEDMSKASAELVNKYKEHYGIDLQNFTTAAAAKAAVQDRLDKALEAAREKQEAVRSKYTFGSYQGRNYIVSGGETYYEGSAQYRAARAEMNAANDVIVSAARELKDFDGDEFVKALTADLLKAYGGSSIDAQKLRALGKSPESAAGKSSGGSSSGGGSGGSKNTLWTMKSGSVYGEGSTKLGAWLNWLDNGSARGKNSDRDILNVLQKIKKEGGWTPAEIETIEKRIYDIQKKIADQKAKDEEDRLKSKERREAEARKKQEEAEKKAHDAQMTRLEYAKAAYERFYSGRRKSLEEENKRISENAAAEIAKLDEAAKKRKEQKEDNDIRKRLREVEDQIEFGQNDEFTLKRLRRQRQDILNERSDIEFDRNLEKQKISIQQKAEEAVQKNTLALEKLERAMENAAYTFARASGTLSAAQVVNHSTAVTNNNYLRQGLSLTDYMSLITALI